MNPSIDFAHIITGFYEIAQEATERIGWFSSTVRANRDLEGFMRVSENLNR